MDDDVILDFVMEHYVSKEDSESVLSDSFRSTSGALAFARRQIGKPYVWGGNGPNSYDCSGLAKAAYASIGINIPRVTSQYPGGSLKRTNNPQPGDLVWNNHHVAIYAGNGKIVHAVNQKYGVRETDMNSSWMGGGFSYWTAK